MRIPHPFRVLRGLLEELDLAVDAKVSNIQVRVALMESGWLGASGYGPDEDIRLLTQALSDALRSIAATAKQDT